MISRAVVIGRQEMIECFLCSLAFFEQRGFIPEGHKQKQQRVEVFFPLVFFLWIVQLVVDEPRLCKFSVHSFTLTIFCVPVVIGNNIVQTEIIKIVWIVSADDIFHKDVLAVWVSLC